MFLLIALFLSFLTTTPHAANVFLTGSKTFEITDYSVVKQALRNGDYIQSDNFTAGGYQWAIWFYPQGTNRSYSEYTSVFVSLLNPKNVVKAAFTCRFRNWNAAAWSTVTPVSSNLIYFTENEYSWGYHNFMKRSSFEASRYLKDDALMIKATLWVLNDSPALSTVLTDVSTSGNSNQLDVPTDNDQTDA